MKTLPCIILLYSLYIKCTGTAVVTHIISTLYPVLSRLGPDLLCFYFLKFMPVFFLTLMLKPQFMPASYASFSMFMLVLMLALLVSFLAVYACFRRLCSRYGDSQHFFLLPCAALDFFARNGCLVFAVGHPR